MTSGAIIAIIGSSLLAFAIKFFNIVLVWLSRVLGVQAPTPITNEQSIDHSGIRVVQSNQKAPDTDNGTPE